MDKKKVKEIEKKANKLMILDNKIWNKYGWESGGDVNDDIHKKEWQKKIKPQSLNYIYYHIFEDANFHSMNSMFEELNVFQGTYEGTEEEYNDYRKSGGRTWNIGD